jgi:hypothetical protein
MIWLCKEFNRIRMGIGCINNMEAEKMAHNRIVGKARYVRHLTMLPLMCLTMGKLLNGVYLLG